MQPILTVRSYIAVNRVSICFHVLVVGVFFMAFLLSNVHSVSIYDFDREPAEVRHLAFGWPLVYGVRDTPIIGKSQWVFAGTAPWHTFSYGRLALNYCLGIALILLFARAAQRLTRLRGSLQVSLGNFVFLFTAIIIGCASSGYAHVDRPYWFGFESIFANQLASLLIYWVLVSCSFLGIASAFASLVRQVKRKAGGKKALA